MGLLLQHVRKQTLRNDFHTICVRFSFWLLLRILVTCLGCISCTINGFIYPFLVFRCNIPIPFISIGAGIFQSSLSLMGLKRSCGELHHGRKQIPSSFDRRLRYKWVGLWFFHAGACQHYQRANWVNEIDCSLSRARVFKGKFWVTTWWLGRWRWFWLRWRWDSWATPVRTCRSMWRRVREWSWLFRCCAFCECLEAWWRVGRSVLIRWTTRSWTKYKSWYLVLE